MIPTVRRGLIEAKSKATPEHSSCSVSAPHTPAPAEIRAARERAGLTQSEAAALAGYGSQSRWAEIESGAKRIDPTRWRYWLHIAGISRIPFKRR